MKPFFKNARFVTFMAYIFVTCIVVTTALGIWQFVMMKARSFPDSTDVVLLLMSIVHVAIPLIIMLATFLILRSKRRAERVIIGAILAGIYSAVGGGLFFLPVSIEPLALAAGEESHLWLQFWPHFVALLIAVVLLVIVAKKQKSCMWQLSPYITWVVAMVCSTGVMASNQITTLCHNVGARSNVGSYSEVIFFVLLLTAAAVLIARRKTKYVVYVAIVGQAIVMLASLLPAFAAVGIS